MNSNNSENEATTESSAENDTETGGKNDKGALWLLVGVVAMVGGTLWMVRDIWMPKPAATSQHEASVTVAKEYPAESGNTGVSVDAGESRLNDEAEALVEDQPASAGFEAERPSARELAEERAELKLEAQRVEQERLEAEQKLAEQREQVKREAERLEAERIASEKKLAQQKAAREVMERKARLEKKKMLEARKAAQQAELKRARAEQAAAAAAAAEKKAEAERKALAERDAAAARMAAEESADEVNLVSQQQPESGDVKFSSNPCDGPSARFLSTCK